MGLLKTPSATSTAIVSITATCDAPNCSATAGPKPKLLDLIALGWRVDEHVLCPLCAVDIPEPGIIKAFL